ncbi:hypothetical protein [Burkholderia sp. Ac-20365]|uniref:hypothetical protein n=1 Tax=Burkholderia sp. Ac-20365 TaxID=2703897 RepID=UPI00197B2FEA|nr:hypothetical protein [Burkholderia sp. Ac-20365]MBN3761097.1 hypothetical protein [Burkholderia sp. Ac-20365]
MNDKETTSAAPDRFVAIDETRYLLSGQQAVSLNPAKDFGNAAARDFILDLFEEIADRRLTREQRELAVKTGLELAKGESFSLGSLAKAWLAESDLRDFAAALLYAAIPGGAHLPDGTKGTS